MEEGGGGMIKYLAPSAVVKYTQEVNGTANEAEAKK